MFTAKELNQITRIAIFFKELNKKDNSSIDEIIYRRMKLCADAGSFVCGFYDDDPIFANFSKNDLDLILEKLKEKNYTIDIVPDYRERSNRITISWEKV